MLKNHILSFNRGEYYDLLRKSGILRRMETRNAQSLPVLYKSFCPRFFDVEKRPFSSPETTFP